MDALACDSCGRAVSAEAALQARARVRAFGPTSDAQRARFHDLDLLTLCADCAERGLMWANVE